MSVVRVAVVMADSVGERSISRAGSCGRIIVLPPLLMCAHGGDSK